MRFLNPSYLPWALLIAVPIALYLFRRKPRTVRVSTLIFFKSLAREHQESAWLRRLKRLLSLLLNVLILALAIGALARPVIAPPAGSLRSLVVLVDRSASMDARDEHGTSRLDAARALLRQRLAGLPSGVAVMVMAYDCRPEILQPFTHDRREVGRALAALRVRPIEGHAEPALRLAARFAALDTPGGIWHATDSEEAGESVRESERESVEEKAEEPSSLSRSHASTLPRSPAAGVTLETFPVGLERPVNAGITAFELRRLPMEPSRFEAFVQMHAVAPQPIEADLEVRVDGALTAIRKLTIDPKTRERLLIPVTAGEGNVLTLKLCVSPLRDMLPLDNEVHARVPELRPIQVLWVSRDPDAFTELALSSLGKEGGIRIFHADPGAWPRIAAILAAPVRSAGFSPSLSRTRPEGRTTNEGQQDAGVTSEQAPDVVIFDGWLPEAWPESVAAVVVDPPRSLGPVQVAPIRGGVPVDVLRVAEERHPLLYGIASARIAVTQTAVLAAEGPLQPIWVGPSGPVMAAGEVRGQRVAVLAFAPKRAELLPLMASYPLLFGNAIYWAAQPKMDSQGGNNRKTGELVALEGKTLAWSVPTANAARESATPLRGKWTELDRIGLWRTDAGEAGSAALLSARETRLPAAGGSAGASPSQTDAGATRRASLFGGDLTRLFLWCVLAFLIIESWLFHRHAVY